MHKSITSGSDKFEQFLEAFYAVNTEIANHAIKLSKSGLQYEVFMWFGILIEAHLSLYLSVYEELIYEVGEVYELPLKNYIPDSIELFRKSFTLGKLIQRFSKVSGNSNLNKRLQVFNTERNRIVHKFVDSGYSLKKITGFEKMNGETLLLIYDLQEDFNSLLREATKLKGVRIQKLDQKLKEATRKTSELEVEMKRTAGG